MRNYICPNCKKDVEVEGDIVTVMCGCGYYMIEQIGGGSKEDEK